MLLYAILASFVWNILFGFTYTCFLLAAYDSPQSMALALCGLLRVRSVSCFVWELDVINPTIFRHESTSIPLFASARYVALYIAVLTFTSDSEILK